MAPYLEEIPYLDILEKVKNVLIKYQDKFENLEEFSKMGDKQKTVYASGFKSSFDKYRDITKEYLEKTMKEVYKSIAATLESMKVVGAYFDEEIKFNMPSDIKEDIDVTDELIKFHETLRDDAVLKIIEVKDYISAEETGDKMVVSDCFYVKNGRVFMRPTYNFNRTQSTLYLSIDIEENGCMFGISIKRIYN